MTSATCAAPSEAILVWHFYHVMFDPDIYPLNLAFWDGRDHTFGRTPGTRL
jgi:hypothetical protein